MMNIEFRFSIIFHGLESEQGPQYIVCECVCDGICMSDSSCNENEKLFESFFINITFMLKQPSRISGTTKYH